MTSARNTTDARKIRAPWLILPPPRRILAYTQGTLYTVMGFWAVVTAMTTQPGDAQGIGMSQSMGLGLAAAGTMLLACSLAGMNLRALAVLGLTTALAALMLTTLFVATALATPTYLFRAAVDALLVGLWVALLYAETHPHRLAWRPRATM